MSQSLQQSRSGKRRRALSVEEILALPAAVSVEDAARALNRGRPSVIDMLRDPECELDPVPGKGPMRATRRSLLRLLDIPDPSLPEVPAQRAS